MICYLTGYKVIWHSDSLSWLQKCRYVMVSLLYGLPTIVCSSAHFCTLLDLSYPVLQSWMCTHMTWDTPAHDIFGFKVTSRQRGAQQADRSSVWEKRSSRRRRAGLLSAVMTSPHSHSLQLLWNNPQPPGFSSAASPLPFSFQLHIISFYFHLFYFI